MSTLTDSGLYELDGAAPEVAAPRPVHVVRDATPERPAVPARAGDDPGLVRAFVIGSIVGFVAVFVILGGMTLALGMGFAAALGIGLFTASWGGPGFGGMMGAVLHYSRNEQR